MEQAAALLNSLAALSAADLEIMRHAATGAKVKSEIDFLGEMADLACFAGGKAPDALELARIQAQKLLLWLWLCEENLDAIARLESECAALEQAIPGHFTEPGAAREPKGFASDPGIAFSWKTVVANAALFIPPEIPILAGGSMAEDLLELPEFDAGRKAGFPVRVEAPLWHILGFSRKPAGQAADFYNFPRVWLIAEGGAYGRDRERLRSVAADE